MSEAGGTRPRETPMRTIMTRNRGWRRFLAGALILHIPLFIYPVLRLCDWLDISWWLTLLVLIPLASSQIVSRMYLRHNRSAWSVLLRRLADLWLGITPVLFITLICFEVVVFVSPLSEATAALWVMGIAGLAGTLGVLNALQPTVCTVRIHSDKLKEPVRFVQITDVHIGSRSIAFLENVISRVNELDPDFVCITGDFIDATGIAETQLKSLKSIVGPVYFTIGNHEKYEDLEDICARLRNLGVNVLRNDSLNFREDLQVIGIDDMDDVGQVERQLSRMEVSREAFVLLLYHRPRGLEAASRAGVDLMISGHTHNGQIMPFNLLVGRVFERMNGLYHYGTSRLYVSEGTGTWGPVMRIGTTSEITLFELNQ
ncbi:MAG: metallophosphoesterase [Pseudomonadales bacterium]|nr:metallophosphoesterase [Pseudomonadales bacterium]